MPHFSAHVDDANSGLAQLKTGEKKICRGSRGEILFPPIMTTVLEENSLSRSCCQWGPVVNGGGENGCGGGMSVSDFRTRRSHIIHHQSAPVLSGCLVPIVGHIDPAHREAGQIEMIFCSCHPASCAWAFVSLPFVLEYLRVLWARCGGCVVGVACGLS